MSREDEHPAETVRELWQSIKADRAKQARATVLLLFLIVGVPLEIWGFLLCPLWLKFVVVLAALPTGLWAWKGLRRDYKGS
jgi:hypothetical protein